MKKKFLMLFTISCIGLSALAGCGDSSPISETQQAKNDTYFAIVDEINNGDYEAAESDIQENYGDYEYSLSADGTNKMLLYKLLYNKQEKYDDEMDVLLAYLKSCDFVAILESDEVSSDKESVKLAVDMASEILDKVSDSKKQEAVSVIGQDILDEYKEE